MSRNRVHWMLLAVFALAPTAVLAQQDKASQGQNQQDQNQPAEAQVKTEAAQTQTEEAPTKTEEDAKLISVPGGKALGMSILGNQEAPKALVIVPWKSSELGNVQGISTLLDDSRLPIDKEVFMRMLSYYEIRSGNGAPQRCADQNECDAARNCGAKEEAMTFTELLGNVGWFGGAVMVCLAVLSLFSVGMIVDKHRRFRSASRESEMFKPVFKKFLHGGEIRELIDAVRQHQNSHVAQVVSAGIHEYDGVRQCGGDPVASLELVTSALRDSMSETLIQLKRGLGFLATIGSTAPFIGLFGTVVGIINAFRSIAATGSGGMSVVSGGIAEALVSTALGIFVAIPAVVAFNHFTGKIETFHVEMNRASTQLVNCLFKIPETKIPELKVSGVRVSDVNVQEVVHAAR